MGFIFLVFKVRYLYEIILRTSIDTLIYVMTAVVMLVLMLCFRNRFEDNVVAVFCLFLLVNVNPVRYY